jgi:HK97 family phage portal protein
MFFARPQASRVVDDDFWFQPVSGTSASGASVSPISALRLSVVYSCVRVLSESVAKLPLRVMRGDFEEDTTHPLSALLKRRPNLWQTSFEFREMMQTHLSLRANAYAQILYAGSRVVGLLPLHPDRVVIEQMADTVWRYKVSDWQGTQRILLQDEVLHLKSLALDGILGTSPVVTQRDAIGTALSAQEYAGKFFKNGAKHSGAWIEFPGKFADAEARAKFREAWRASLSGENTFSTPVLDQGMKMHELGMTMADAQFLESRKYGDADICRIFGVPQHMVGILDRATNNNIEHQGREFYSMTLMALLRRWEEAMETALLMDAEQETHRIEFDADELLRADSTSRATIYHNAILDGWMTRNEARAREHMAPIDGLDEPLSPMNMNGGAEPPQDAPEVREATPAPAPADDRAAALLVAAADRCVVREVNGIRRIVARYGRGERAMEAAADFYGLHADWVAKVLGVEPGAAALVCEQRFDELRANDVPDTLDRWEAGGGRLLMVTGEPDALQPMSAEDRRHKEQVSILARIEEQMRVPSVVNVNVPEQAAPVVNVQVPEQAAPVVNVAAAAAPVVNVAAPSVTVEAAMPAASSGDPPWPTQTTIKRRDAQGRAEVFETRPVR